MKKYHKALLIFMVAVFTIPMLNSCRKGEEDPWFSVYSRTNRLCRDWKILSYRRDVQTDQSITSYIFDGTNSIYKEIRSNYSYISPADMRITFNKDGEYTWELSVITDTSSYIYSEKGFWYYTDRNKESDIKAKEQLALQKKEYTESFSNGSINQTLSYVGSGDLATNTFRLKKLASDEMIMVNESTTTYFDLNSNNLVKITTEIIFQPR